MTQIKNYQPMMEGFKASDQLKGKVLQEIEGYDQEMASEARAQRASTTNRPETRKKTKAWPVAITVGIAAVFALFALLVSPAISTPAENGSQSFGLLAYAEAGSPGSSIELQTGESTIVPAGSGGDDYRFRMNLSCYGEGIESLTYTIEGTDVHFGLRDTTQENYGEAGTTAYSKPDEFTVEYNNQNAEGVYREIGVTVVDPELQALKEEEWRLQDQRESSDDPAEREALEEEYSRNTAAQNARLKANVEGAGGIEAYFVQQTTEAACKLGDATLHITAKYSDESTETRSYKITPVGNFEEAYSNYSKISLNPDHDENNPALKVPLFLLSEVS